MAYWNGNQQRQKYPASYVRPYNSVRYKRRHINDDKDVRRMDSLARVLHVYGHVVTAVGISENKRFTVGINQSQNLSPYKNSTSYIINRYGLVNNVVHGNISPKAAYDALADTKTYGPTENKLNRPLSNNKHVHRLEQDLIKINKYYKNNKNSPFNNAIDSNIDIYDMRATHNKGHAEEGVSYRMKQGGVIGVTKLNCASCHDYFNYLDNTTNTKFKLRGTHGIAYPNIHDHREVHHDTHEIEQINQYANDSDSDNEFYIPQKIKYQPKYRKKTPKPTLINNNINSSVKNSVTNTKVLSNNGNYNSYKNVSHQQQQFRLRSSSHHNHNNGYYNYNSVSNNRNTTNNKYRKHYQNQTNNLRFPKY